MRVGIVGGTGLVGGHAAATLAAAGHEVVRIARRPRAGVGEHRAADVESVAELEAALRGCEAVVSCFGSLRQSPDRTFRDIHVRGLSHLLTACRSLGLRRLVHVSTLSASASSASAYDRAKHAAEDLLGRALVDCTILRPSAIFGPDDDFVVPLSAFLRRLPIAPLPRGRLLMQPIAAADVARAIAFAIDHPETARERFDLCGPEVLTLSEIYSRVMEATGVRRPKLHVPYVIIEPISYLRRDAPGTGFSFDQLAVAESEVPSDPLPAAQRLGLDLTRFTVTNIQRALAG